MEMIPTAHRKSYELARLDSYDPEADFFGDCQRLAAAHRVVFESVSVDVRRKATHEFVRILKEENGASVKWFSTALFHAADIQYVEDQTKPMVQEYLLGQVGKMHSQETLHFIDGITPFLPVEDAVRWVDPFVRLVTSAGIDRLTRAAVITVFARSFDKTKISFDEAVKSRLDQWIESAATAEKKRSIQDLLELIDFPV